MVGQPVRTRFRYGAKALAVGAAISVLFAPIASSRAADGETPDTLLQEGTKLAKSCGEPKPNWAKKKVSGNFDVCGDAQQAFVKAIELSKKDVKIVEAASPPLTTVSLNKAASAVYIGHHYTESENREAALGFFRVACIPFEPASAFAKPTPEQIESGKKVVADAEEALQGFHRTCKSVAAED